eukprot:g1588.t1
MVDQIFDSLCGVGVATYTAGGAGEAPAADAACATSDVFENGEIEVVFGRRLHVPRGAWRGRLGTGVARFDFADLCGRARGSADYSALAQAFGTVVIDGVPKLDMNSRDQARRFITLVDELYNRRVRLVCRAAVDIDELFSGDIADRPIVDMEALQFETETEENKSRLDLTAAMGVAADNRSGASQAGSLFTGEDEKFAFSRAVSRLHEMQSLQYLLHHDLIAMVAAEQQGQGQGQGLGVDPQSSRQTAAV